jgi:hypothetical protein
LDQVYVIFLFDFIGKQIFSTNSFAIPGIKFDDSHSGKYGGKNKYDKANIPFIPFLSLLPALQS